jgi:hypothetical protein
MGAGRSRNRASVAGAGCQNQAVAGNRSDQPGDFEIERALTGGDPRRLQNAEIVVETVLRSPGRVEELLDCVFSRDEIVRMRASDALEKVCRQRPELLQPHVERVLGEMSEVDQPSVQWHLAQIVGEVELNQEQRGRAIVILERNLTEIDDWIVVNLSLEALARFARDDPRVVPGLVGLLRHHENSSYKSVRSRVRKLLGEFDD